MREELIKREKIARILRERILNVLPAASYQMDRFLQLVDIAVSDRTETACVEIGPQPKLHLNAAFVKKYCKRDEHLFMLVLHELYHIILGHTRLFPRITELHNIAFDAIINSMLCHQFKDPVYLEFFQKINSWKRFPARLLRPHKGWPEKADSLPREATEDEVLVLNRLYGNKAETVTYQEVLELLQKRQSDDIGKGIILLGDHSGQNKSGSVDGMATNDDLLKEILRRVTEGWPDGSSHGFGKGDGSRIFDYLMPKPISVRSKFLQGLKKLLDKTGTLRPDASMPYAWKPMHCGQESMTAIPNWRDRQAHSKEILFGETPLLYKTEIMRSRPRWVPRKVTHLYVDISGSMDDSLPWLATALDPLHRKGLCKLYAFSTVVDEVKRGRLTKDKIKNTGGTDINCVYEHLVKLPKSDTPQKVVVLTDGYTGVPKLELEQEWKKRKVKLYVGLIGDLVYENWLEPYATHIEKLPKLN
jgi:hypothetical protein